LLQVVEIGVVCQQVEDEYLHDAALPRFLLPAMLHFWADCASLRPTRSRGARH
jgi:hypothetical protein